MRAWLRNRRACCAPYVPQRWVAAKGHDLLLTLGLRRASPAACCAGDCAMPLACWRPLGTHGHTHPPDVKEVPGCVEDEGFVALDSRRCDGLDG